MKSFTPRAVSLMPMLTAGLLLVATTSATAQDADPYQQPDDSWISIEGTVTRVTPDAFNLDYDGGDILVEFDNPDPDPETHLIKEGDRVSVAGRIDDDAFETATIEASSVYVESLATYFYASALDDEDAYAEEGEWWQPHPGISVLDLERPDRTVLRGSVSEVGDGWFTIDRGTRQVTVRVDDMAYDPLDAEGYQRIEPGDYVSVTGEADYELFEGRHFDASTVVTLWDVSG